jgi:hypothetical protein
MTEDFDPSKRPIPAGTIIPVDKLLAAIERSIANGETDGISIDEKDCILPDWYTEDLGDKS